MTWKPADPEDVVRLFERIRDSYPHLRMILDTSPEHVDVLMEIPVQPGLSFRMALNLQGDELHLNAGDHFWLEWFPGYENAVIDRYVDAVNGLLSGRYRIVESFRGSKAVRAELQALSNDAWQTIGTWATIHVPLPWRRTHNVLWNR